VGPPGRSGGEVVARGEVCRWPIGCGAAEGECAGGWWWRCAESVGPPGRSGGEVIARGEVCRWTMGCCAAEGDWAGGWGWGVEG